MTPGGYRPIAFDRREGPGRVSAGAGIAPGEGRAVRAQRAEGAGGAGDVHHVLGDTGGEPGNPGKIETTTGYIVDF